MVAGRSRRQAFCRDNTAVGLCQPISSRVLCRRNAALLLCCILAAGAWSAGSTDNALSLAPPFPALDEAYPATPSPSLPPAPPPEPPKAPVPEWRSAWRARYAPVWGKCPAGSCLAIVTVMAGVHQYAERSRLRRTYMHERLRPVGIAYLFVLSQPKAAYDHAQAELEFETHQDLVWLDSRDCDERWCSLKQYTLYEWVAKTAGVGRADFWVRSECDTVINPYALKLQLLQLPRMRVLWGRWCGIGHGEPRGDQSFFAGGMLAVTWDLAQWLVTDSKTGRASPHDKVRTTNVGADDIMISEWFRDYVPVQQWVPMMPCEFHDAWGSVHGGCDMQYPTNEFTVAIHNAKTHDEWASSFAELLPLIRAQRDACEPPQAASASAAPGDSTLSSSSPSSSPPVVWKWNSPRCVAHLPPVVPCLQRNCPPLTRQCPAALDAMWAQKCPQSPQAR